MKALVILGGAATALLIGNRRRRRHRDHDDSRSYTTTTTLLEHELDMTSDFDQPALEPVMEDEQLGSRQNTVLSSFAAAISWEGLVVTLLTLAVAGVALQRQMWDLLGLAAGGLLLVVLIRVIRLLTPSSKRRRRRKARSAGADDAVDGSSRAVRAQSSRAAPAPPLPPHPDLRFDGTWVKDTKRSDPMNTAMDMMSLNGVVRLAVSLVKGIELHLKPVPPPTTPPQDAVAPSSTAPATPPGSTGTVNGTDATGHALPDGTGTEAPPTTWMLEMAVFSVVSWFKVRERYKINGPPALWNRRDLRRGKHVGRCTAQPDESMRLELSWGAPIAGHGYDEFRLESADELHVTSHMVVGARRHTYCTIYTRKK